MSIGANEGFACTKFGAIFVPSFVGVWTHRHCQQASAVRKIAFLGLKYVVAVISSWLWDSCVGVTCAVPCRKPLEELHLDAGSRSRPTRPQC